MKGFKL